MHIKSIESDCSSWRDGKFGEWVSAQVSSTPLHLGSKLRGPSLIAVMKLRINSICVKITRGLRALPLPSWQADRTVKRQFQLGELVLVITPSRPNKLSVQWVGPGEIVQQLSKTNYVVKFPEKDKTPVYHVNMLKPYHQREENINLLCINPLKHDEEEDIPSLELEKERSGWSKIISDVQLNSKLSQIQRGQLKELLYEYSNLFSNIPDDDLAEHDILESEHDIDKLKFSNQKLIRC
ncbi:retrovirus-related Pol polyprotein from transposon 412 [Trichonephila clavipes]|nr:retrovirus-related Pol polyprotein from transposon 412 [Trichonephila clavipes]